MYLTYKHYCAAEIKGFDLGKPKVGLPTVWVVVDGAHTFKLNAHTHQVPFTYHTTSLCLRPRCLRLELCSALLAHTPRPAHLSDLRLLCGSIDGGEGESRNAPIFLA